MVISLLLLTALQTRFVPLFLSLCLQLHLSLGFESASAGWGAAVQCAHINDIWISGNISWRSAIRAKYALLFGCLHRQLIE